MVGEAGFEPATSASRTLRAKPAALLPDTYPIITGTREQGNAGTRRVAVRRSRSQAVAALVRRGRGMAASDWRRAVGASTGDCFALRAGNYKTGPRGASGERARVVGE